MESPFTAEPDVDDADVSDGTGRTVASDGGTAADVLARGDERSRGRASAGDEDGRAGVDEITEPVDAAVAEVATEAAGRARSRLAARGDVTVEQERVVDELARTVATRLVTEYVDPIERLECASKAAAPDDPGDGT